jgi:hypothetical protein
MRKNKLRNIIKKQTVKLSANGNAKRSAYKLKTKSVLLSHVKLGSLEITADKILMAATDHHKIKALVIRGKEFLWFERTCSLDELISTLDNAHFKRISKFYALNKQHCFSYLQKASRIHFKNGHSELLAHPFALSVYLQFMR